MKKYSEFLQSLKESHIEEASGKNFIDVFDEEKPFGEPVYRVHRDDLIDELEGFLMRVQSGTLERVSVFADLPAQGKNRPSYLSDPLPDIQKSKEEMMKKDDQKGELEVAGWAKGENDDEEDVEIEGDFIPGEELPKAAALNPDDYDEMNKGEEEYDPWAETDKEEVGDDEDDDEEYKSSKGKEFIDVEFEVVGVDKEQNLVVGMPYSLKRKKITTPIHPKYITEIYYKKAPKRSAY